MFCPVVQCNTRCVFGCAFEMVAPDSHRSVGIIFQRSDVTVVCAEMPVLPAFSSLRVKRSVCVGRIWGCCFSVLSLKCTPLYGYFRNFFSVCIYVRENFQPSTIKLDPKHWLYLSSLHCI